MGAAASAFGSSPRASTVTRARQPKRAAVGEGVRVASTELLGLEEHPKEEREKQLIALAVSRSILFAPLRDFPHLLDAVVAAMFPVCAPAGEVLITQGDPLGDTFYVLSTGECAIVVDGREVARAGAGDSFGELALLYASPRTSTVTALVPTRLWALRLAAYKAAAAAAAAAGAERLARLLGGVGFFSQLSPEQLASLACSLSLADYAPGAVVVAKGEPGEHFFLVVTGRCVVTNPDGADPSEPLAEYGPGGWFGERALLAAPDAAAPPRRAATVTAATQSVLAALSAADFANALALVEETATVSALRLCAELAPLSAAQLALAAAACVRARLPPGTVLFRKGDAVDELILVEKGRLEELRGDSLGTGGGGGGGDVSEEASPPSSPRATHTPASPPLYPHALSRKARASSTLAACSPDGATVLRLARGALEAALSHRPLRDVCLASRAAALRRVPLLAGVPHAALVRVASSLAPQRACSGKRIVTAGEAGDAVYLVERGEVAVIDGAGAEKATLSDGQWFGELALGFGGGNASPASSPAPSPGAFPSPTSPGPSGFGAAATPRGAPRPRTATVVAKSRVVLLLALRGADFEALCAANPDVAHRVALRSAGYAAFDPPRDPERESAEAATAAAVAALSPLTLADLKPGRPLGSGAFGTVWLVTHGAKRFALKQIDKRVVLQKGLAQHALRERDVLAECSASRFCTSLTASFQDDTSLYLLMEAVLGGELFERLQSLPAPLGEADARFYAACVVEALDFLHARFYVYRDLKPENLLIGADGYLKVADFSFVKRLRAGKTFTLCGTPAYLAPEQITRSGHDRAVDWWALGVLLYEMMGGFPPFWEKDVEPMFMFRRIVEVDYSFAAPAAVMSAPAMDVIFSLLQKAPHARLPMGRGGVATLRAHPWFRSVRWDALRAGRLRAPFVPAAADVDALSYFPDAHDPRGKDGPQLASHGKRHDGALVCAGDPFAGF